MDDDDEIRDALLERDEVEFKTIIWTNENKDWLLAQEGRGRTGPFPVSFAV